SAYAATPPEAPDPTTITSYTGCVANLFFPTELHRAPQKTNHALEYFRQRPLILSKSFGTPVIASSSASYSADIYPLYPPCAKSLQTRSKSMGRLVAPKTSRMCACVACGTHASMSAYISSSVLASKLEMSRLTPK